MNRPNLNPAQQEVLDLLGAPKDKRPRFKPTLAAELNTFLDTSIKELLAEAETEIAERTTDTGDSTTDISKPAVKSRTQIALGSIPTKNDPLVLTKHKLAQLNGCQLSYIDDLAEPFAWKPATARGTIIHKAIELSFRLKDKSPVELAAVTMAHIQENDPYYDALAQMLNNLTEVEHAELENDVANAISAFIDGFPPIRHNPQWNPTIEMRHRNLLADGRIQMRGKTDLTLGRSDPEISQRVIIDIKTGRYRDVHIQDLRFYGLCETLRYGVAPRIYGTFYLDESRLYVEHTSEEQLAATARQVVDSVATHLELVLNPDSVMCFDPESCYRCRTNQDYDQ